MGMKMEGSGGKNKSYVSAMIYCSGLEVGCNLPGSFGPPASHRNRFLLVMVNILERGVRPVKFQKRVVCG